MLLSNASYFLQSISISSLWSVFRILYTGFFLLRHFRAKSSGKFYEAIIRTMTRRGRFRESLFPPSGFTLTEILAEWYKV
jgi:hypothetical protein